jgi:hypothetical protein
MLGLLETHTPDSEHLLEHDLPPVQPVYYYSSSLLEISSNLPFAAADPTACLPLCMN